MSSDDRRQFGLGCALAVVALLLPAEVFLRSFPPTELHAYMGEASPLTGIYKSDEDFGVAYRSWEAFCADAGVPLRAFLPFPGPADAPPIWAFFGNSFVQAPGMLADHVGAAVPNRRVFKLGRNELVFVRLGQIKLLLEHGMQPERIFVELMPVDTLSVGEQPLATIRVTTSGALTYEPRLPGGVGGWLVDHSALARAAWFRAGQHRGNPRFNKRTLYQRIEEPLLGDLRRLFGNLARLTQQHRVPVTMILIPSTNEIVDPASAGFDDTVGMMLRQQGYDVFDARDAFRRQPDLAALYLPDRHLTPLGNAVLLRALLDHIGSPR